MSHQLLIVEDDDGIALPLLRTLGREGYEVERVTTGASALERTQALAPDLLILDLGLPDMDGLDVCRRVRTDGYQGGVLILTARGSELDRVVGLDVGADDYLAKPFGLSELLARARALLRRTGSRPTAVVNQRPETPGTAAGDSSLDWPSGTADGRTATGLLHQAGPVGLRVDPQGRRVWVGDAEVQLTTKEFDLLALLDSDREAVLTRERLMDEVWDENWFGSTKTLDVTMGRLRQKLENHRAPVRIVTVRGVGFRLETKPAHA